MVTPTLLAAATADPHPAMILPFALMLLAIALMPFIHLHWWERHFPKVAMGLGAVTTIYYVLVLGNAGRMLHVGHELLVRDVVATREEIRGLMENRLFVDAPPLGKTKLSEWVEKHKETLGRHYTSEMRRRVGRTSGY